MTRSFDSISIMNSPIHQHSADNEDVVRNENEATKAEVHDRNSNDSRREDSYYRPLSVFFCAFLIAWVYVMIPCNEYWVYFMVKYQYWCALTLASFVELFAAIIPDVTDGTYIASYVFGFFVAPFARLLAYLDGLEEHTLLDNVTVLFSFVIVFIFYSIVSF